MTTPLLFDWKIERRPVGAPLLVPFLMNEAHGTLAVEVYEDALPIARDFLSSSPAPFRSDALRRLHAAFAPYLARLGYREEPRGATRYYESYLLPRGSAPPPLPTIAAELRLLREEDAARPCRLSLDPALLIARCARRADLPAAAAISPQTGEILSLAAVGDAEEGSRVREITVETVRAARGQGFGSAVVAALARELLRQGYTAAYCTSRYNCPSRKIARALGFLYDGRFAAVTGEAI